MKINYKTKSFIVYDFLRKQIANGNYVAGDKMIARNIAKEMGVSDIPVREAIKMLESRGFVEVTPHVGAKVTGISCTELKEIYQVRGELEGLAIAFAIGHISKNDFEHLRFIHNEFAKATLLETMPEVVQKLNKQFHFTIYNRCSNKFLLNLISRLWEESQVIRTINSIFSFSPEFAKISYDQHDKILNALETVDVDAAIKALKREKELVIALISGSSVCKEILPE
jgi:DNA-binding GntR family transcriptional regulator